MSRRSFLKISCFLIVFGLGCFSLGSFVITILQSRWTVLATQLRNQGWSLTDDLPVIRLSLRGFKVTLPQRHVRHSSSLCLDFSEENAFSFTIPFDLGYLSAVSFESATPLLVHDDNQYQGHEPAFTLACDQIKGQIRLLDKSELLWPCDLQMTQVRFQSGLVTVQSSQLSLKILPALKSTILQLQVDVRDVQWTPMQQLSLFNTADRLVLKGHLETGFNTDPNTDPKAEAPFATDFSFNGLRQALSAGDATIELEQALFQKEDFKIEAKGTLSLDQVGQPLIALSTHVQHIDALLQDLARYKILPSKTLQLMKLFLFPLKKSNPQNASLSMHQIPLSLQQGVLSLGPFLLMRVPPIVWGAS